MKTLNRTKFDLIPCYDNNSSSMHFTRSIPFGLYSPVSLTSSTIISNNDEGLSRNAIEAISKVKSFAILEENWDSYGALPIKKNTIHKGISFIKDLNRKGQNIFFIAPEGDGEIMIELKNENKSIEFFIYPTKDSFEYLAIRDEDDEQEGEINNDIELSKLIAWLNIGI
jgi:hypothetical protein